MKWLIGLVQTLKDKIKLFCGKIDEDKFLIMFSLFFSKYNFHFAFIPSNWKEFYYDKEGKKFIDNDIRYCLSLGIFQFIWHDFTGIEYIHVIVDQDYQYHAPEQQGFINRLIYILRSISDNHRINTNIPCTFNYSIKPNGNYIYYLTVENSWLTLNNLGALAMQRFPDCYLPKNRINYYFPKFNTNKNLAYYIPYVKNTYFEGEA